MTLYSGALTGITRDLDEASLRRYFAAYGDDVDVRLRRSLTGASYGFAFLRLRASAETATALCATVHDIGSGACVRVHSLTPCRVPSVCTLDTARVCVNVATAPAHVPIATHDREAVPPPPPPHDDNATDYVAHYASNVLYLCYPLQQGATHALVARRDGAQRDRLVIVDVVAPPKLAPCREI